MTTNRFSEPFAKTVWNSEGKIVYPAGLTDEQAAVIEARSAAWREWLETGDRTKLVELGVFPKP